MSNSIVIRPKTTSTGKSPDYPGVVSVIDIGLPTQAVIVVEDPRAALAWAQQITRAAEKLLERLTPRERRREKASESATRLDS